MLRRATALLALAGSLLFLGCGGSMTPSPTVATQSTLFAADSDLQQIVRFDDVSMLSGNVNPNSVLGFNPAGLPSDLAVDAQADRMFFYSELSNITSGISVYDHATTRVGGTAPDRQIAGPATTLVRFGPMVLDSIRDTLYAVGSSNPDGSANVVVFTNASTANGNVTPARILKTGIQDFPFSMALDQANDRLFVSVNGAQIDVYEHISAAPTGAITPTRVITGPLTGLTISFHIALDGHGHLLVLNDTPSVTLYDASTANGNVPPVATITSPTVVMPEGMAVDQNAANGGDLYIKTGNPGQVLVFTGIATANGSVNPARTIQYPTNNGGFTPMVVVSH
jgi:hypothetical protein